MTEWNDFDEYDDDQQQGGNPKLIKDLRKQLSEKSKAEKALADQLADLQKRERTRNVREVLSAKGVNPKVAALVPDSVGEDEESVGKWLNDFGDVFGIKQDTAEGATEQTTTIDPGEQVAQTRIMQTSASGKPPESGYQETLSKLQNAPVEDVLKMIAEAQGAAA